MVTKSRITVIQGREEWALRDPQSQPLTSQRRKLGPREGQNLLQTTGQGRQSWGQRVGIPTSCLGLPTPFTRGTARRATLTENSGSSDSKPPSHRHPPGTDSSHLSAGLWTSFQNHKGGWSLEAKGQGVPMYPRTFQIICADHYLVPQIKGDL